MIKCIMFDLGDVIVRNRPYKACTRLAKHCPLNADEFTWFAPKKVHGLMDVGKLPRKKLYLQAVKNLGLKNLSQKKFEDMYADIFTNNKPVQNLAKKLGKKYKLILLSNTDIVHFDFIRKNFPIIKIFDSLVLSYRVGYKKPGSTIYKIAVKRSRFKPKECVFVDNMKVNVTAATKLGIKGVQYTTTKKLRKDLKNLGVEI